MISSKEILKGLVLDIEGEPYMMLDWQRIGEAQVNVVLRMKLRHLRTHAIIERTLDADQKVRLVPIDRLPVTFAYWDGELYHFVETGVLDPDTPDEIMLPTETLGEASKYIIDDLQLELLLLNGDPVGVELPESVVMRVKETEPVVGGVGSHYKPATMEGPARLETGLVVQVPWFISTGDWIRVNTANGEYIERV